jgi:hypothetical protein
MPAKLTTTVSKIAQVPNKTNSAIIEEFYTYMRAKGSSEQHQNNVLKTVIAYANFLGSETTFLDVQQKSQITAFLSLTRRYKRDNCQSIKSTLAYITITSVKVSREEQIKLRRNTVLELRAQGLTQQEIANKLSAFGVSRRTIGNDLEYLRQNAYSIMQQQQRNIAFEYQQVLSNFHQLRRDAWARFNDLKIDERQRLALYHILMDLNHDILDTLAVGDMIERETMESMQQDVKDMQNALDEMKFTSGSNNNNGKNEQAIF